jgi:hypothetical protein
MSPTPYPIFAVSENDKPEQVEKRIKLLIRLYLAQHEQDIAAAVVEHINAILAHPQYITDVETRCQFRRLAEHWRCLAWTDCSMTQCNIARPKSALSLELEHV